MKNTGIVRRMDQLGRIVIPKELRLKFGIRDGDPLEIYTDDNEGIILKKYRFNPVKDSIEDLKRAIISDSSIKDFPAVLDKVREIENALGMEESK